ncbi:MAG: Protein of unknown function precursor [Bacteroidetes bacterium]|nr:Protein of unknown function precursor [Bacteroidota bacterium]
MKIRSFLFVSLLLFAFNAFSQDYLDNRTMKITEVSTDKTYAYDLNNPVKVGPKEKATGSYLNGLKFPGAEKMHIADMQFNYKGTQGLQMIVLSFEGSKETKTIYVSTAEFETPKAPVGFGFKTSDDMPKIYRFPADSIAKVNPCNPSFYSVDNFLLKEKLAAELPKPDKAPSFKEGDDALKKFFRENPLTDEKAKQLLFRVAIAFAVNCEGKAGNYQIVTQGHGDMETFANEVLAIVNKMPQGWAAAEKDGKAVDCYQVITFTVSEGKLTGFSYK